MQVSTIPKCVEKFCDFRDQYVFKKCAPLVGCEAFLVVLEKPDYIGSLTKPFISNESRSGVDNEKFAKFRCNGLFVKMIISLTNHHLHESVSHYTRMIDQFTLYRVGHLVTPSGFDQNLDNVCRDSLFSDSASSHRL